MHKRSANQQISMGFTRKAFEKGGVYQPMLKRNGDADPSLDA
jgi:hypothetical protein